MRWNNFTFLVKQGVNSVWYNRMMSFASFCVLLVSLLLVGVVTLTALNINVVLEYIENQNQILIFTDGELSTEQTNAISFAVRENQFVSDVSFQSREETWAAHQNQHPEADSLYAHMQFNPMPNTFLVTVNDLTRINAVAVEFERLEGVIRVNVPHDFAELLISARTTLTLVGGAVILALIIVCLIIIYNSSRASVFSRRQEINIMKYVGATNAFVKIPFFIEGMFIGVIAGVCSWLLTQFSYSSVIAMFGDDVTLWAALGLGELIAFDSISLAVLIANCIVGSALSATGIIMSMGKHLKV
ncbi:MAG: permease-like cell division protein FtsX [Oscillospiraceae bacterium]|nr:permease-like cell division protein FtsX [Oscillospiraceae bacterium]